MTNAKAPPGPEDGGEQGPQVTAHPQPRVKPESEPHCEHCRHREAMHLIDPLGGWLDDPLYRYYD